MVPTPYIDLKLQCNKTETLVSHLVHRLKACKTPLSLDDVRKVHADAVETGMDANIYVLNTLIDRYAKCGSMSEARYIFDRMHHRTVVSWNSLLLGYAESGEEDVTLELFQSRMDSRPDARTFVAVIKACSSLAGNEEGKVKLALLEQARWIDRQVRDTGFILNVFVAGGLLDLYAKCGSLIDAARVFDELEHRDVACWNSLLLGYAQNGEESLALEMFHEMKRAKCSPDERTFVAFLKACRNLAVKEGGKALADGKLVKVDALSKGMAMHAQVTETGHDRQVFVGTSLVDVYCACGSLFDAQRAFHRIKLPNVVSWNALILGHAENGASEMALELFYEIDCEPDARTFVSALKACANLAEEEQSDREQLVKMEALEKGMSIHSRMMVMKLNPDVFVMNTLLDMYVKCRSFVDARTIFEEMPSRNVVTWNALLLGYAEAGEADSALELFIRMRRQGYSSNARTYVPALMACGTLVALEVGRAIHTEICRCNLEKDPVLQTCLIDFYGKCSSLDMAQHQFDMVLTIHRSQVTWNALLTAYSRHGELDHVFHLLHEMEREGVQPDGTTFTSLLAACSHAGLVSQGNSCFRQMVASYGLQPEIEHFHCLVDGLGRGNQIEKALELVQRMPYEPTAVTWRTLLGAWKNVKVGKVAFKSMVVDDK